MSHFLSNIFSLVIYEKMSMSDTTSNTLNTLIEEFADNFDNQDKENILSQLESKQMDLDLDFTLIDSLCSWILNSPVPN